MESSFRRPPIRVEQTPSLGPVVLMQVTYERQGVFPQVIVEAVSACKLPWWRRWLLAVRSTLSRVWTRVTFWRRDHDR